MATQSISMSKKATRGKYSQAYRDEALALAERFVMTPGFLHTL